MGSDEFRCLNYLTQNAMLLPTLAFSVVSFLVACSPSTAVPVFVTPFTLGCALLIKDKHTHSSLNKIFH